MASPQFKISSARHFPVRAGVKSTLVDSKPILATLDAAERWAKAAVELPDYPPLGMLPDFLPATHRRSLLPPRSKLQSKISGLVGFSVSGDSEIGVRTRWVLPLHFVIMRILELVPRTQIELRDETKGSDRKSGRQRSAREKIYRLNLTVGSKMQGLGRFLFNVPTDAELHERRGPESHRYFIPAHHVITKIRKEKPMLSQRETVALIEVALANARNNELAYEPERVSRLLNELLAINDDRHWEELQDRLPDDPRRKGDF